MLPKVTDEDFEQSALKDAMPVAVLFKSAACPYCVKMAAVIEEVAAEYADKLKVLALDISEGVNTAIRYGVMGVPQILFFKAGRKVGEIRGWVSRADVTKKIEAVIQ